MDIKTHRMNYNTDDDMFLWNQPVHVQIDSIWLKMYDPTRPIPFDNVSEYRLYDSLFHTELSQLAHSLRQDLNTFKEHHDAHRASTLIQLLWLLLPDLQLTKEQIEQSLSSIYKSPAGVTAESNINIYIKTTNSFGFLTYDNEYVWIDHIFKRYFADILKEIEEVRPSHSSSHGDDATSDAKTEHDFDAQFREAVRLATIAAKQAEKKCDELPQGSSTPFSSSSSSSSARRPKPVRKRRKAPRQMGARRKAPRQMGGNRHGPVLKHPDEVPGAEDKIFHQMLITKGVTQEGVENVLIALVNREKEETVIHSSVIRKTFNLTDEQRRLLPSRYHRMYVTRVNQAITNVRRNISKRVYAEWTTRKEEGRIVFVHTRPT